MRPPYFLQSFVFGNPFKELEPAELEPALFEVKLIINNGSLTYVYLNTIET